MKSFILLGYNARPVFCPTDNGMPPLINAGIELTLVGMGTVFFFLTVLVLGMRLMAWVVGIIAPVVVRDPDEELEVAAIAAALALHRKTSS